MAASRFTGLLAGAWALRGHAQQEAQQIASASLPTLHPKPLPFDLLGLYQGVSMMERGAGHVANDIDRIFLYRRPILDYWCESQEDLPHIVRHVLIHEIGHHFGLSDDDMEAIEAKAEEESRRAQPGA